MSYTDPGRERLPYQGTLDWTSHEAATKARRFAGRQGTRLLAWYRSRGEAGSTDHEAAVALGMARSSICARRNELMVSGLVERRGDRRRVGQFGVEQQVWRAVEL
jgi:hypothetical protein